LDNLGTAMRFHEAVIPPGVISSRMFENNETLDRLGICGP
jgi:hypothetical protein